MSDLKTTLVRDFERNYREAGERIRALVEPLTDEQIWTRPYPYGNSIGHLLLHLTGNLSYYIGAEMGGTDTCATVRWSSRYVHHPKAELLANLMQAIATVKRC